MPTSSRNEAPGGAPQPPDTLGRPLATAFLTRRDVPAIHAVYAQAMARVPDPSAIRLDTPAFFETMFDWEGEILGLFDGAELIAYGVLRPEVACEGDRVGLGPLVPRGAALCVLDGSAVLPTHWQHGLQRTAIDARLARAAELGYAHAIALASPGNVPSMRNLTRQGFRIVGLARKSYGWRYVHHRAVTPGAKAETAPAVVGEWCPAADVEVAQERFGRGEVALSARRDGCGVPVLFFAAPDGDAPDPAPPAAGASGRGRRG